MLRQTMRLGRSSPVKVSLRAAWDAVQVFILIWAYSVIHAVGHEIGFPGGEPGIAIAFGKLVNAFVVFALFVLPIMTIREAYAMMAGKFVQTERLRSLPHPKRNGLLYLWTGLSALVLCVLIQFTALPPSLARDLVLACGGVFVALAIAAHIMPARAR